MGIYLYFKNDGKLTQNLLNLLIYNYQSFEGSVSEWLRRWTRNPLGSSRAGSNPAAVVFTNFRKEGKTLVII
jgi:hypothetical protein